MKGFALVLVGAGVLGLCFLAALSSNQRVELQSDDVMHDSAMKSMGFAHRRQARGRTLRADSSIQDFFKAAMNGDFQKGSNVKRATSGLFGADRSAPQHQQHQQLKAAAKARKQQLSEANLRLKAAHAALAQEARAQLHEAHVQQGIARRAEAKRYAADARMMKEAAKKYPTEDKFVARYTGGIPSGDVVVDTILPNPFTPL